jgi:hypothetical protein
VSPIRTRRHAKPRKEEKCNPGFARGSKFVEPQAKSGTASGRKHE